MFYETTSSPSENLCFLLSQKALIKIDSFLAPELDRESFSQNKNISIFFKILSSSYSDFLRSSHSDFLRSVFNISTFFAKC